MNRSVVALGVVLFASSSALAQGNWDKTYNLSARPSLQVELDNAAIHVGSCGGCRAVRIRVDWQGQDPSHWQISEMQGGNGIHFELKQKEHSWLDGGSHGRSPEVTVDAPADADLDLHSGNGSASVAGLHGALTLRTGNGGIQTDGTAGALRLESGNGSIQIHNAQGTLTGTTGHGTMTIDGRFSQFDVRSSNGGINLSLLPGSQLQSSSHMTAGNGSIALRLPRDLRADVDIRTGNGAIANSLPMNSASNDRQHQHGTLNGGGPSLSVQTGNGSVALSAD